jgi:transcription initiation factor TFIIIB Brf1 subunit/transcription initiation factor TFIIB
MAIQVVLRDITARKQAENRNRQQLDELRRWQEVTLGREARIHDLKREVNELCRRLGEPPRYLSAEDDVETLEKR